MEATANWNDQVKAQLINIANKDLAIKELKGQRVVTFKDIDMLHERVEGTAKRNFNENNKYFINGTDYYKMTYKEFRTNFVPNSKGGNPNNEVVLITESGYLMLVKSLTDDLAWKVQRELVNKYFRTREIIQKPSCVEDVLIQSLQAIKQVKEQLNQTNHHALEAKARSKEIKDEISVFKKQYKEDRGNDPLFGIECDELQRVVKRVATNILGGHGSPAYLSNSINKKVFADVQRQIKREFGLRSYKAIKRCQLEVAINIVEAYKAPFVLQQEIDCLNNQFSFSNSI